MKDSKLVTTRNQSSLMCKIVMQCTRVAGCGPTYKRCVDRKKLALWFCGVEVKYVNSYVVDCHDSFWLANGMTVAVSKFNFSSTLHLQSA